MIFAWMKLLSHVLSAVKHAPTKEEPSVRQKRTVADVRQELVRLARAELGKTDAREYHLEAFSPTEREPFPESWCQSFFITMLRRAGLFRGHYAMRGRGFETALRRAGYKVVYTQNPEPGDLAYFNRQQHHAMVERADGGIVKLLQGNGVGRKVTESQKMKKDVDLFYSIRPVIDAALDEEDDDRTDPDLRV